MVTARSRSLFAANRRTRNTQGNTDSCCPTALCFVGPRGARFGSIVPDRLIFLAISAGQAYARAEAGKAPGERGRRAEPSASPGDGHAVLERASSCQSADGGRIDGVAPGDVRLCLA